MTENPIPKPYAVFVDDNFHYMDESERYKSGEFSTFEEAIKHCQKIVDEFLVSNFKPGMSVDELYDQYVSFGDDPFIRGPESNPGFSAWSYAKQRCEELCSGHKLSK